MKMQFGSLAPPFGETRMKAVELLLGTCVLGFPMCLCVLCWVVSV